MPSLNTADTTLALSTIDESLNTGQRDPRSVSSKVGADRHRGLATSAESGHMFLISDR